MPLMPPAVHVLRLRCRHYAIYAMRMHSACVAARRAYGARVRSARAKVACNAREVRVYAQEGGAQARR